MSKQIIEKHMKGVISVFNDNYIFKEKSYKGAAFLITIPIKKDEKAID